MNNLSKNVKKTNLYATINKRGDKMAEVIEEEKKRTAKKMYHIAKREDGKWQVKFAGGSKAIKLFNTKAEAVAYTENMATNQDAGVLIHPSKGKNKGRFSNK